jgi:hypothetical protein
MIRLDLPTRKLQALLAGAVATSQPLVTVGFALGEKDRGNTQTTTMNGVTAVDICDAPPGGEIRNVDFITVYNADTASVTVTIRMVSSAVNYNLAKLTLAAGEIAQFSPELGFEVVGATGI